VIEIKAGKFKPEHVGQLGFYMTAIDVQVKHEDLVHRPLSGCRIVLLCQRPLLTRKHLL
jgi:hypothetical protein